MEQQLPNEPLFELQVDHDSGTRFKESAKWGQFVAIIYFIGLGFFLLGLTFGSAMIVTALAEKMPLMAASGGLIIGALFIVAAIYVFIAIQLYRYCTLMRAAIDRQDLPTFHEALKALKNYFLVSGVVALLTFAWSLFTTLSSLF
jgi:hypothetical protein